MPAPVRQPKTGFRDNVYRVMLVTHGGTVSVLTYKTKREFLAALSHTDARNYKEVKGAIYSFKKAVKLADPELVDIEN